MIQDKNLIKYMKKGKNKSSTDIRDTVSWMYALDLKELKKRRDELEPDFLIFRAGLEAGTIRAAERNKKGDWITDTRVKEGILVGFRIGENEVMSEEEETLQFVDKDTYPPRRFDENDGVRVVPGGVSVRSGSHIGKDVILMPPAFVNVGAYVGNGTMIDSLAVVGSCAQVGDNCHISAGAKVGGVLEPVNASPCIVEDDVMMGANTSINEGTVLKKGAVLAPGVNLTRAVKVFDTVKEEIYQASKDSPLIIPEGAIVVPGVRAIDNSSFAKKHSLGLNTGIIRKYRDSKTDAATALEESLR